MSSGNQQSSISKEVLLQHPGCTLQLERDWSESGAARHAFKLYPSASGHATGAAVSLLSGEGHDVSRREIHYALYLFQRHDVESARGKRVING
ncbi:MAG: hypothetical protein FJX23_08775 [Alphaproteobacteria bacterium]|nr:hypothetical protein [Alphaproteobacteria bacterium]